MRSACLDPGPVAALGSLIDVHKERHIVGAATGGEQAQERGYVLARRRGRRLAAITPLGRSACHAPDRTRTRARERACNRIRTSL